MGSVTPSVEAVTDEDAYTSLLEICTELIISEGTDDPPVHHAIDVLHGLLHCDRLSGDATVLSVRAVRILLDKFVPCLKQKSRAKLIECVRAALQRLKTVVGANSTQSFTFVHTKLWELQEELLQCMAAAAQSDESIRVALPPAEEQLSFCVYVMDVSLDMCLQALRMCCVLLRSGQLGGSANAAPVVRIRAVLREKLMSLETLEVNQDWLRLLRHLTDGLVTMKAYTHHEESKTSTARQDAQEGAKKSHKRQRSSSAANGHTASPPASTAGDASACSQGEVEVWLRLCQKVCASPRLDRAFRSTVFSCASAVIAGESAVAAVPAATCVAVVVDLAKELSRNVRTTLAIVNPFLNREAVSGATSSPGASTADGVPRNPFMDLDGDADEDEEQGEDLLNNGEGVKWVTPEPEWPLLRLISALLSAKASPAEEYMWWWVGDDEYARRFAKDDRAQLTRAFFAAQDAVQLKKRGSRVRLSTMREVQWPFANSCRVIFQPVPCAYDVSASVAPSLQVAPRRAEAQAAALRQCNLRALLEQLSAVSRYDGALAEYGRSVLLQVLMAAGPDAVDATRAALRSFLSDATTALIESVSQALLQHDKAWAPVLVEVGVATAILRRSASNTPERSPVVQMLRREAASLPTTPPLHPQIPASASGDPSQLVRILQSGSRDEVRRLLVVLIDTPESAWNSPQCVDALRRLAASNQKVESELKKEDSASSAAWWAQLEHLLTGVVLKHLQELALQCLSSKSLKETVEEAEIVELEVCSAGLSPAFSCPRHHPLRHHHSTNWTCDVCKAKGLDSAWSCRLCDYDVCAKCAMVQCNRLEGAVTATALDVLAVWRLTSAPPSTQHPSRSAAVFFTETGGAVSTATPLACLHRQRVHAAELCASCACGVVCPGPSSSSAASEVASVAGKCDLLVELLVLFGAACGQDVAVQRCLLKAYENAGMFVFIGGARAVPAGLRRVMAGLARHLPLNVKHLVARYLAVDCRRFAFQVLHDQSAAVMSMVTGVTAESVKSHKIQVPREDKAGMLRILHDSFRSLLSPVLRVDFTFVGEEGFGSGPSQELYTELSAHFRAEKKFWFVTEDDGGADAVTLPFPTAKALFLDEFFVLGAACARAFVDDFRMNLDLLPEAWALLMLPSLGLTGLGQSPVDAEFPRVVAALDALLEALDPSLHRTFTQLRRSTAAELAAMELEMDDGAAITTHAELERHIQHTILTRYEIAFENLRQFQWGLLSVLELESFAFMSDEERSAVLCGAERETDGPLFTEDELRLQTTVGNGYSSDSPHVEMFLAIVGNELTRAQQHHFLEFLTGSPRLPLNGLAGLGRLITVAMKDMEGKKEMTLPSCNTCFLYLKLPPYSTREIMKARLLFAITEGRRNYSLS